MEATLPEPGNNEAASAYSKLAVIRRSFWLSLLSFSPSLLIAVLWVFVRSSETSASVTADTAIQLGLLLKFTIGVAFGPFLETATFHLLVIELLFRFGLQRAVHVVPIAAIPFIAAHLTNSYGMASAISVIPGGFVLAYCYWYWRQRAWSWRVAFAATWLTHGLHNFYFWLLNFVPASLIFG